MDSKGRDDTLRMRRIDVLNLRTFEGISRKRTYITLTPLIPQFYIVKLGFTGYALFFLFLLENIDYGYSLEPPRRGGSNEYPYSMFWAEIWKISEFLYGYFQLFGGEIFNIFELACFCNDRLMRHILFTHIALFDFSCLISGFQLIAVKWYWNMKKNYRRKDLIVW